MHIDSNGKLTNLFYNGMSPGTARRSGITVCATCIASPEADHEYPYIGQVGWNAWEDLRRQAGKNFGWSQEGNFSQTATPPTRPVRRSTRQYAYCANASYSHYAAAPRSPAAYTCSNFLSTYSNRFFFGDYGHGFIRTLQTDANDNLSRTASSTSCPAECGPRLDPPRPDGYLYYAAIKPTARPRHRPQLAANSRGTATDQRSALNVVFERRASDPAADRSPKQGFRRWHVLDGCQPELLYNAAPITPSHAPNNAAPRLTRPDHRGQPAADGAHHVAHGVAAVQGRRLINSAYRHGSPPARRPRAPCSGDRRAPRPALVPRALPAALDATASGGLRCRDHGDDVPSCAAHRTTRPGRQVDSSINPQTVTSTARRRAGCLRRHQRHDPVDGHHGQFTARAVRPRPGARRRDVRPETAAPNSTRSRSRDNTTYRPISTWRRDRAQHRLQRSTGYETLVSPPLNILGDWTVEAWFKDENPAGYNHDNSYIVMKGDTNQSGEAPYMVGIAWNQLFAGVRTGFQSNSVFYNLTQAGVTANAWHHVAVTYNDSTSVITMRRDAGSGRRPPTTVGTCSRHGATADRTSGTASSTTSVSGVACARQHRSPPTWRTSTSAPRTGWSATGASTKAAGRPSTTTPGMPPRR
jgi:hypothetical protein